MVPHILHRVCEGTVGGLGRKAFSVVAEADGDGGISDSVENGVEGEDAGWYISGQVRVDGREAGRERGRDAL